MVTPERQLFGLIVTMSGDRKTGYMLKTDQPLGERAGQICVYNRLANLRLFDARKPGVPPAALLKAPEEDAARHCYELAKFGKVPPGGCTALNAVVQRADSKGERVVLQGLTVAKNGNGAYAPDGTLATLSGNVGGSINDDAAHPEKGILGHIYYSSLPDGATVQNATLVYVEYSPYALTLLP